VRGAGAAFLAAVLAAGCVSETSLVGTDAHGASRGGNRAASGIGAAAHPDIFDPPKRGPDEIVQVPADAYAPVDLFFDNEGYLVGDRVEIDCSFEPFRTRLVAVSYEGRGDWVVREEGRDGDVLWVRLKNGVQGSAYQQEILPTATFGSHREPPPVVDRSSGKVVGLAPRPVFQFVATEELTIRFHVNNSADRPVWFRARAVGTPPAWNKDAPQDPRDVIYMNANRRRRVLGPALGIAIDLRRDSDGSWGATVDDPRPAAPPEGK
jgi:hypothetical protein